MYSTGKPSGPTYASGRPFETGGAAHQVGVFAGEEERHEAAARNARHGAMAAVRDGAQGAVDLLHQFGKVQGELALRVRRPSVHQNQLVRADVGGQPAFARRGLAFHAVSSQ